ncbi:gluconate 2-dehydrogenase subunit 3 family protein [Chryseolinea sp. T2]|uniref:gluconate 2-dehydrogenase subunit 3 family protein n=1 Tax=Chryseolinea sp. T2 TaxID=3129255 RepID=UPI0030769FC3
MNRREAIQRTAMVLGYAVAGPAMVGVLNGCKAKPELPFKPAFLTADQAQLVVALSDVIMPKTDTPGAVEAGVPQFIDDMFQTVYTQADKDRIAKGMAAFDEESKSAYGDLFASVKKEEQIALVKKHHEALAGKAGDSSAGWWRASGGGDKPFIVEMKELILLGFFTSQPGATQVLQYNQAPGPYQGCVPLTQVGKTWAT